MLPGPWIPEELIDPLRGPVQRKRRAVLNTGQVSSTTLTSQTTYEGREGSSIVSWEIVETYSNGTGAPSNGLGANGVNRLADLGAYGRAPLEPSATATDSPKPTHEGHDASGRSAPTNVRTRRHFAMHVDW